MTAPPRHPDRDPLAGLRALHGRKRKKPNGSATHEHEHEDEGGWPEVDTSTDSREAWREVLRIAVEEMNARHFVALVAGKAVIVSMERDSVFDRERPIFSRTQDIKLIYANRRYRTGTGGDGGGIYRPLGDLWLGHPDRRTYRRMAIVPNGEVEDDTFNLWRGWGVEPKAGGWPKLREHMLNVVCSGNQDHFAYLLRWCAHCVQHPERQAEVAVVLRGLKGTGKGTLAQVMIRIFRDHAVQITQSRHLTGNFNAHLLNVLFLFVDEAFWAGDRAAESTLKAMVTEAHLMCEPKGCDPFPMPNRLKIMMASNNDWVVPATADERRYFVLDVSDARKGDRPYWVALHKALNGGERETFLAELLAMDLSGFEVRDAPHTAGLNRQKLHNLKSVERFWLYNLQNGTIYGSGADGWPMAVVRQDMHTAYLAFSEHHKDRHPVDNWELGQELNRLWAGCTITTKRPPPDRVTGKRGPRAYQLDTLERHREAFAKALNVPAVELFGSDGEDADN